MAYNIRPLRQQNLFDDFSLGSLGDLSGDSSYSYGNEEQDQDPTNRSTGRTQPSVSGPDLSAFRGVNVNPGSPPSSSTRDVQDPRETPEQRTQRLLDAIGKVYTPSNTARDRFGNLLDNPPERNQPSFGRRLVAMGAGLGNKGMGVAPSADSVDKVLYAPYLHDMADWTAKVTPYSQAAQQENTANSVERQLAGNLVTGMYNQDRIESQQRIADEKNLTAKQKIENDYKINADKNAIARIVAGGVKDVDFKGRNVIVTMKDGTTFDTGVETTNYSPLEQEAMRQSGAMARTVQTGENQANVARIQGQNAVTTKTTPGASIAFKPGDEMKMRQDVLQRFKDTDPDAARWIKNGPNGLDMGPRPVVGGGKVAGLFGSAWTQKDVDSYDRVARAAHPNTVNQGGGQAPIIEHSPSTGAQRRSTDGGRTWEYSNDGGKTWTRR